MWSVPREWEGETVVILAGGPSTLHYDLKCLRGRKVIAINSVWNIYPDADVLFFADERWWRQFKPNFNGLCVTTSALVHPRVNRLAKVEPFAMSLDPRCLALRRSSVTGAINLALHFGAAEIVIVGLDGQVVDGRRHSHGDKYPWPLKNGCFDEHAAEFRKVAPSIPVPVINANPASMIDVWPKMKLEQAL